MQNFFASLRSAIHKYLFKLYIDLYVYSFTCTAWLNGITVGKPMCALKIRYIYLKKQKIIPWKPYNCPIFYANNPINPYVLVSSAL